MNLCAAAVLTVLLCQLCMVVSVEQSEDDKLVVREKRRAKKGCRRCDENYYNYTVPALPTLKCPVNKGGCKPVRCKRKNNEDCNRICKPKMRQEIVTCPITLNGETVNKTIGVDVVDRCRCKKRKRVSFSGRVVFKKEGKVTGIEGVVLTLQNYKKKTFMSAELGFFSFTLNLKKFKPKFPKRVTITARKNGYIFSIKHVDVADESTDNVRNIEIVLFARPEPITFNTTNGVQLDTTNAVSVRVPANTEFEDEDGNAVTGQVNAVFLFIDPASGAFEDSPGEFITDDGQQLTSLGLFIPSFEAMDGSPLKPRGNIDVENADPDVKGMRLYRLMVNGQWEELPGGGARRKRQTDNNRVIGSFGPDELNGWINCDRPAVQKRCYVKMRVFEDNTFSTEVTDGQDLTVTPKVLLKVYEGSSVLGLNLNPAGTDSPGQHCYAVRCTTLLTSPIKGEIMLYERRTDIDSFSLTQPVPANNPNLPPDLPALEYEVDTNAKRARLRFDASAAGPLFEDENVCKLAPKEKSLWFALGPAQSPGGNFGDNVCVMRVRVMIKRDQNNESQSNPLASLTALSNWGISDDEIDNDIVDANEMVPIPSEYAFAACSRYECSKTDTPTTVAFLPTPVADTVSCSAAHTFEPPVINSDIGGYYYGTDEGIVKATCKASGPSNPYANHVVCF